MRDRTTSDFPSANRPLVLGYTSCGTSPHTCGIAPSVFTGRVARRPNIRKNGVYLLESCRDVLYAKTHVSRYLLHCSFFPETNLTSMVCSVWLNRSSSPFAYRKLLSLIHTIHICLLAKYSSHSPLNSSIHTYLRMVGCCESPPYPKLFCYIIIQCVVKFTSLVGNNDLRNSHLHEQLHGHTKVTVHVHENSRLEHTRKRKGKGEERKRKRGKERTINI